MFRSRFIVSYLLCLVSLIACSDTTTYSVYLHPMDKQNVGIVQSLPGAVYSLPRAYINVIAESDGTKLTLTTTTELFPDSDARFKLIWAENEFADDHFKIGINEKGLLTTINSENTDKTPAIITKLVQIAEAAAFRIPPGNLLAVSGLEKFSVKLWIDPFSRRSVERANNRLAAHHLILQ
jgi:hypothetical protein